MKISQIPTNASQISPLLEKDVKAENEKLRGQNANLLNRQKELLDEQKQIQNELQNLRSQNPSQVN